MDKIYPPNKYQCSKHIPLNQYFKNYGDIYRSISESYTVSKNIPEENKIDAILDKSQIFDKSKRQELIELCSLFDSDVSLSNGSQARKKIKKPVVIPEDAKNLHTIKARMKYKHLCNKEKHQDNEEYVHKLKPCKIKTVNIQPGTEYAVAIRVYNPFTCESSSNVSSKLQFSQEIVVLGSNTLADFRDKISCRADLGLCTEVEYPIDELPSSAKEKYPSGFIFIDNVFYNDMRNKIAIDYSEVIRNWAKEVKIEPLTVARMEDTKINDLTPMFGYPYVYQHQGGCEHIITFSNAWLLINSDSLNTSDYPYIKSIQRLRTKHCILCYKSTAKWICYNSDRLPHAEAFLCQKCLLDYNYKDGKKIGNFRLYPYYDETCSV